MGLNITNLNAFPIGVDLKFYIYFLDYGWDNELSEAMYENFQRFSKITERNSSVVIQGMDREHFANEVLNWHSISGNDAEKLLPAILITDINPQDISESNNDCCPYPGGGEREPNPNYENVTPDRFVLIPLTQLCKTKADVTKLMETIEKDLDSGNQLTKFSVQDSISNSEAGLADAFILKPNFMGVGFDLKKLFNLGRKRVMGASSSTSSDNE